MTTTKTTDKRTWLLLSAAAVLAAIFIIFFTNWFQPKTIKVFHSNRNLRPRLAQGTSAPNLIFGLNHSLRLTAIKVVPLAEYQTNEHVFPLWHLISESNSAPVRFFFYDQHIRGLKPAVPGNRAKPLATNVTYRIIVEAGKITGEHDFEIK